MAIEARHYEETRRRLMADPVVRDMASTVAPEHLARLTHEDGTPRFVFMSTANREYRERGGADGGHIGAIAEAIVRLVQERVRLELGETNEAPVGHDCPDPARVTCGSCGRSWCERHDPAPSALCHWCNGRGFSIAPLA